MDEHVRTGDSRVPQVLAGSLIPFGLATLVVLARFYTRGILTRNWAGDDSWVLVSWILGIVLVCLHCVLTRYGTGHHSTTMNSDDFETTYLLAFAIKIVYQIVLGTTKIAICCLFLCIFQDTRGRRIILGTVVFTILYTTALLGASIFQCTPINRSWKHDSPGTCTNYLGVLWTNASCNVLVNAILLVVTIPRILRLNINQRQKIALLAVISLGFAVIAAAIVRVVRITQFNSSSDASWDGSDATTWSALEVSMGLVCVSAPTLRPLFRRVHQVFSLSASCSQSTGKAYARSNPQEGMHNGGATWCGGDVERHLVDDGPVRESRTELIAYPLPVKSSSYGEHKSQENWA